MFGSVPPSWSFFIVPVFGLLGVILKWWLDNRSSKIKANKAKKMGEYFSRAHDIYKLLGVAKRQLGASRALLLRSENGGGVPTPGAQLYVSVVYESYDPPMKSCRDDWQKKPIDAHYASLLNEVFHKEYVALKLNENMPEGVLKDYYITSEVAASEVIKIYSDDTRFVYLAFNYHGVNDLFIPDFNSPQHKTRLRNITLRLKNILNEMGELVDS